MELLVLPLIVSACDCRTCECWEPAEEGDTLCLGCLHGAHPGELE